MLYYFWFIGFVLAIFLLWKLDLFATLLNLKALTPEITPVFQDLIDEEAYAKSQEYTRDKSVLGISEGVVSLIALLLFWWFGGDLIFELID